MRTRAREEDAGLAVRQALRFSAVSVATTVIDLALFNLLILSGALPLLAANTVSYGAGVAASYVLNRRFTFPGAATGAQGRRLTLFLALNIAGLWLNNAAVAAVAALAGQSPVLLTAGKLAAGATMWVAKFLVFRRWVYPR